MQYNEKYYGKSWKWNNRKAIKERKKAGEELGSLLAGMVFLISIPFIVPIFIIGKILGVLKKK